jgi:hypothetical protein
MARMRTSDTEMPERYEVFVPAPGSMQERMIDAASGIVGTLDEASGRILIDFEGNRFGGVNLANFADRVHHAAGRHGVRYPTVARALVAPEELIHIGEYDWERGNVSLTGAEAEQSLARWLGQEQLDRAALETQGNVRHQMRREVETALANPATREQGRWLARHYKLEV